MIDIFDDPDLDKFFKETGLGAHQMRSNEIDELINWKKTERDAISSRTRWSTAWCEIAIIASRYLSVVSDDLR